MKTIFRVLAAVYLLLILNIHIDAWQLKKIGIVQTSAKVNKTCITSNIHCIMHSLVLFEKLARQKASFPLFSKRDEPIPENETEEEKMERLRRKARRMMFNEKGVPYAPWMARQVDEDVRLYFCISILHF